jgi:hypothetical protein
MASRKNHACALRDAAERNVLSARHVVLLICFDGTDIDHTQLRRLGANHLGQLERGDMIRFTFDCACEGGQSSGSDLPR